MKKNLLLGVASLLGRPAHARTTGRWLQRLLLAAAVLLPALGQAQSRADAYGFTQTNGTYTAVTGTVISASNADDDVLYAASTIPFSFTYAGTAYTSLRVTSNGFIAFGLTTPATTSYTTYTPISATEGYAGAISALGLDGGGRSNTGANISTATVGLSPNREFVVQYTNWGAYGSVGGVHNYQIRLAETSNIIRIVYGSFTGQVSGTGPQVGLRGALNTDFNNRRSAVGWALTNTGAALTNAVTVAISATLFPASGLTFTYTPSTTVQLPAIRPTATAITGTTATVAFTAPAPTTLPTGYTATITPAVAGSPFTSATSPFNITGLSASTNYTVSVVANYAAGNSLPTETRFVTPANCVAPTTLAITNNTTGTSANLSFTNAASGVTNYTVTTSPATSTYTVNSAPTGTPLALTGLSAATAYTVNVVSNCTAGGNSTVATTTFTTPSQPANFTTARNTGVAYTSIASTGTSFPTFQATSLFTDDNVSATVPLTAGSAAAGATAFAFNYLGLNVQGFQISTNGFLTFNTANTSAAFGNNLSLITPNLVLAPFWEDLVTQGNPSGNSGTTAAINASLAASMKYQVSGTAPNRKLTVEWIGMEIYQNPGPSLNFQVILTETANTIEYRYGEMSGFDGSNNYSYSYSLGMNGVTAATPNTYLAQDVANSNYFLQNNASAAAPSTITATTTLTAAQRGNSLSIVPACNSNIVFTPSASFTPNLPPATAVPTNDDPAGATTLVLGVTAPTDFCSVYSSANATATASIPVCTAATAGTPDDDVWFQFVVPATSNVTVTLRSSGTYDGVLQIFSDAGATAVACLNATGAGLTETYTATGLAAGTYYVRVYHAGTGSAYNGTFVLAAYATPTPPANDECAGAITLPSNGTTCTPVSGTTLAATASAGITACTATAPGTPDDDVWYKFTTGSTAVNDYNITLQGASGFDGVLQLFSGSCGALTPQGCINNTSTGGAEAAVTNGLTANTDYFLRVYHAGAGTGSGNFTICVYRSCNAPASVAAGTVTTTSANITFTNGGSGNFTVTATPTTGSPVTATGTTGTTPGIALTGLASGTTYSVVVQGDCGAGATSTAITFTTLVPAPANDQCAGAISLSCGSLVTGSTASATTTNDPTATCTTSITAPGVFYAFTGTGRVTTVSTDNTGTNYDTKLYVYSGSCGTLTCVGGNDDKTGTTVSGASEVTFVAASGTQYYVFVAGYQTGTGTFALSLDCNSAANNLTISTTTTTVTGNYNDVTVTGTGNGTLSGTLNVYGNLNVQNNGTLNTNCQTVGGTGTFTVAAGGTLGICSPLGITSSGATGAVQNTGTRSFSSDANYIYNGTAAQATGNGLPATVRNITVNNSTGVTLSQALSVRQLVRLQSGNLATGGNTFTLLSVAGQGTALIDNTGGLVTGTGTMQRAIDVTNPAGIGYRHYSAPVSATTIGDLQATGFTPVLNSGYNSAASPGLVTPFPTVYGYDETRLATATSNFAAFDKGWFSPAATSTPMEANHGYTANIADGTLVDFVGTYNSGAQSRTGLTRGTDAAAGWHLLGNPYPSPLDWDLVDNTPATSLPGMEGSMYVFQSNGRYTGTYRSYVNGIGGNPIIDAGQGYFVRVATAGTPGSVNLTDAHRVTTFVAGAQPAFGRGTADIRPLLSLSVTGNGQADETSLYFENGATNGHDPLFDAVKRTNMGTMSLGSALGSEEFAINGLAPLTSLDVVVPLTISNALAGSYHFDTEALRNFASTTVWLRDAATGAQVNLSQGSRYAFTLATAGTGNGRFSLLFRPGTVTASHAGFEAAQVLLFPNPAHGAFTVSVPSVANARTVQATLLNALGQTVLTRILTLGATGAVAEFSTTNLAAGVYIMQLRAGDNLVTKRVVVE